jgi:NAD(P)H dehydrogenase (quinone)
MIAILGATGKVGGAAATELRRRGLRVRAVVRDAGKSAALAEAGCEIAVADLHDGDALKRALEGARAVLAIIPPSPKAVDVLADAQGIIDALAGALEATRPYGVVAISDYGAQHASGTGITTLFHRLEARLRTIPVATTFLRSSEQMQNWMRQIRAARERGILPSLHHPVTRPFPAVSAFDVGAVAADLLANESEQDAGSGHAAKSEPPRPPRVIHVEGPRRYAAADFAPVLARIVGRPVVAQPVPRESWVPALVAAGLGESYARLVAELQDAHNAGLIDVEAGAGEVRPGPTELADALR